MMWTSPRIAIAPFTILPRYQKKWKECVKLRHLLANKPKVTHQDKQRLLMKEDELQNIRTRM